MDWDDALYAGLLPSVQLALTWIEQYGDLDGDGLIEYRGEQTSPIHIRHQVWKDSGDSLHHVDGRPPRGYIAPVEVQGYSYAAYQRLAEVAAAFGDGPFAATLRERAGTLKARFNDAFWMEEEQFYAQALDGDKSHMGCITSNPGQLLFTGIAPPERAQAVARRLQRPDMESGWGVRTLSSHALTYNPMSYHNGSVWPHDNSLIAAVLPHWSEQRSERDLQRALRCRIQQRTSDPANSTAGSAGVAAQSMRRWPIRERAARRPGRRARILTWCDRPGLEADIAANVIRVRPALPEFLNEVTIQRMTVLGKCGSLNVRRDASGYHVESDGLPLDVAERSGQPVS